MLLEYAETDWLASKNYFYNTRTNEISDNFNDLLDKNHIEFHPEGLNNYLSYGYSVFGQTPVKEIKFLLPNTKITKDEKGKLVLEELEDPFEHLLGSASVPEDTENYLSYIINDWVNKTDGVVVVPTSGGFDSRIINSMIVRKDKIHAYSYGISKDQKKSFEVVYASNLCKALGIKWEQIELGDFHTLIDDWDSLYGAMTHEHGMYQMEFYKKIQKKEVHPASVISGIYGDLWAGSWKFDPVEKPSDLINLSITHGICIDKAECKLKAGNEIRDCYFEKNKEKLRDDNWKVLLAGRTKITLLSYLLRVPEYYGFHVWSPFLNETAVAKMLTLDWKYKEKRKWQIDYFKRHNLLIGDWNLECDKSNFLDQSAYLRNPLKPLNVSLLKEFFEISFLEQINRNITVVNREWVRYYNAYLVLYPIQRLLEMKER